MPGGELAWKLYRGPRVEFGIRLPRETQLVLSLIAGQRGVSMTRLVAEILERETSEWLHEHADELREAIAAERERREVRA